MNQKAAKAIARYAHEFGLNERQMVRRWRVMPHRERGRVRRRLKALNPDWAGK